MNIYSMNDKNIVNNVDIFKDSFAITYIFIK
jgi:hypothetical protein